MVKIVSLLLCVACLSACNKGEDESENSPQKVLSYQVWRLQDITQKFYKDPKTVPEGDITKTIILAGGTRAWEDKNVLPEEFKKAQENMSKLIVDPEKMSITNQFGGSVHVVIHSGLANIIYEKAPKELCNGIDGLTCVEKYEEEQEGKINENVINYIAEFNDSEKQKDALINYAKSLQNILRTNRADQSGFNSLAIEMIKKIKCIYSNYDDNEGAAKKIAEIKKLTIDTRENKLFYSFFSSKLNLDDKTIQDTECEE